MLHHAETADPNSAFIVLQIHVTLQHLIGSLMLEMYTMQFSDYDTKLVLGTYIVPDPSSSRIQLAFCVTKLEVN